jgi:hypothetical protein
MILPFIGGAVIMQVGFISSMVWLRGDAPTSSIPGRADQTTIS